MLKILVPGASFFGGGIATLYGELMELLFHLPSDCNGRSGGEWPSGTACLREPVFQGFYEDRSSFVSWLQQRVFF